MPEYQTLDNVLVTEATEKAIRIVYDDKKEEMFVWIPRSVCEDGLDLYVGDQNVCVETWFIEKEGLPT